jgi:hypothetical protein
VFLCIGVHDVEHAVCELCRYEELVHTREVRITINRPIANRQSGIDFVYVPMVKVAMHRSVAMKLIFAVDMICLPWSVEGGDLEPGGLSTTVNR